MADAWGPWVSDRLPSLGMEIEAVFLVVEGSERRAEGVVTAASGAAFTIEPRPAWADHVVWALRWRARRPRALRRLVDIAEGVRPVVTHARERA